ncbi:cation:proton antiporter [Geitlerinema sp. PCC 7407]|uniref:cation:proton antiporter n=1 Tax=Geitlerinema sp. PCC 7407 TaxID=1173025 RepID=UPI00029FD082|nr:cation:proton antiporter [Geitlerinema sp. PCC 7407]AFY67080.1 transporter, CPA2 family [Geitlerinema sp. PCC 7407]
MESVITFFQEEPIVPFTLLLAVILMVPLIFKRLGLPELVGLLVAGIVLGPNALNLLQSDSKIIALLSDIGLVYLMFVAGLEIDIQQFRVTRNRSIGFGSLTFAVPMVTGIILGRAFGFGWNASILIGSLLASHTLLAYPIISRMGVVKNEAVTVTIGATIFTDIGALLVLAVCVGIHAGDFTTLNLITLLGSLIIYSCVVLFGFDWVGRHFFKQSGDEEGNQFLFVLLSVFLAALGAQLIGVEKIIGAFLAGLAVNDVVGESPVKEKVIFVGSVLFIPIFFIDMGLLINVPAFIKTLTSFGLTLAIVLSLIGSKFVAALLAKLAYRYSWQEMIAMWSLSLPQVAATLAATLVGYKAGLLTEEVLNSVIVLMLVTATLGPIITARSAVGLKLPAEELALEAMPLGSHATPQHPFTIVVPVSNPNTQKNLIEMAALLAKQAQGRIVPLAIALGHTQSPTEELTSAFTQGQNLVQRAVELSREHGIEAQPLVRIDNNVAQGVSLASLEQDAQLIVMGWGDQTSLRTWLFGNMIDNVLWASHCTVAVTRLLDAPHKIQRILAVIETVTTQAVPVLQFSQLLAAQNQANVTLLHVCTPLTPAAQVNWLQEQLTAMATQVGLPKATPVWVVSSEDVAKVVLGLESDFDLVVLRFISRRTSAGGLAISDLLTPIIENLEGSVVLLGEPHH